MKQQRAGLGFNLALASVAAATTWIVLLSWRAFTMEPEATVPLLYTAAIIALVGGTARWLHVPTALGLLLTAAVAGACVLGWVTGSAVPSPSVLADYATRVGEALDSTRKFRAPVPVEAASISPLLITAGAAVVVTVDTLAGGLRRIPLAGLLLLAVYCVPVSITGVGLTWPAFVALAIGFLAMLHLVHLDRVTRWGRGVDSGGSDRAGLTVRTGAVVGAAIKIGALATALALALPLALPTYEVTLFDGPGPGKREIQVADPLVDLRRDLARGEDIPLLQVTTPHRDPSYLRIAVLTRFNGNTWTPGDRDIPDDQVASGPMPPLVGVTSASPRQEWPYRVEVNEDFESRWLPTTAQVSSMTVEGDWRYDLSTMDFMTSDPEATTAGLDYSFTGVGVEPDAELLDEAASGISFIDSSFFEIPSGIAPEVGSLAAEVTQDQTTRFRKAQALQQWFREDGGFEYSTANIEEVSEGTLTEFLDERVGYCEQFAASMAIMARVIGIPARVAVGFLRPDSVGPDTYEFSSHDLHAWPELFFPGAGWVRFEPTPGARAASVPAYTSADLAPNPTATPSARNTPSTDARSRQLRDPETTAIADEASTFPWVRLLVAVGTLALLLVGVLAPTLVRRRRRERRLRGDLEELWRELRDHVTDLGHEWPADRSPRRTGAWVSTHFGAPAEGSSRSERPRTGPDQDRDAVRALDRFVEQLERARYSRSGGSVAIEQAAEDVLVIEAALDHGVGPRVRRRARWLPRSLRHVASRPARAGGSDREVSTRTGSTETETTEAVRG
ncbi:transglutaminaseTgpA domain-containing protein [Nocardioides piscis]|uniref:Transglutaminase domain-containing protein n=1 Tax=Nocardioides piscis TaxID=2714938 RepID=A0A6G7YJB3_9ACTN|nr:DUF3488 and transglutaminase-like domain-containing protein [Nocardioides piscis]QIK76834.1 transglutaminase domain-containing protein [Nocardioides piscis]